jgi:hypothetical protein
MTVNSLAPAFVKLHYTVSLFTHDYVFGVDPASLSGDTTTLDTRGAPILWTDAIDDLVAIMKSFFADTATSIDSADLYSQPTAEDVPEIVSSYAIGVAGVVGATSVLACQHLMTFRSYAGGLGKVQWMETVYAANLVTAPASYAAPQSTLETYLLGDTCPIIARDNANFKTSIRRTTKTNDKLRKKRLAL